MAATVIASWPPERWPTGTPTAHATNVVASWQPKRWPTVTPTLMPIFHDKLVNGKNELGLAPACYVFNPHFLSKTDMVHQSSCSRFSRIRTTILFTFLFCLHYERKMYVYHFTNWNWKITKTRSGWAGPNSSLARGHRWNCNQSLDLKLMSKLDFNYYSWWVVVVGRWSDKRKLILNSTLFKV